MGRSKVAESDRPDFDREAVVADLKQRILSVCRGEMDINPFGIGVTKKQWAAKKARQRRAQNKAASNAAK